MADPDRVRPILTSFGYTDISFAGAEELMSFGDTTDDVYRFVHGLGFTRFMLEGLDDAALTGALEALRARNDAHHTRDGVLYPSAGWGIAARRR
jgi:hypothetical protein